ncbi:hypothetical protein TWF694_009406 [Orbilia ellipsospora]|uniref:Calcineurin-like phosphoesterase domain-containing protein n=1 Tax=Orbilia ellipsospora TaxID=2528407 RepID=A0AAV9XAR5_9PEZI
MASSNLRVVCVSDTHNDDCRSGIPHGDIFIHAGDMTDFGTIEELQKAYDWIASLPHKLKIVTAGNHDFGLDSKHPNFLPEAVTLFTSETAKASGIHYIDRRVETVSDYKDTESTLPDIRVYGNPCQPEFIGKPYAFIYNPSPSDSSTEAWNGAPTRNDKTHIWVMHSPPKGRLDSINKVYRDMGLIGCEVQAIKIAAARPLLCVFGHYHFSWGVERVRWQKDSDQIEESEILSMSSERRLEEERTEPESLSEFSFEGLEFGRDTIFVNAAWKTMKKGEGMPKNKPIVINLSLEQFA